MTPNFNILKKNQLFLFFILTMFISAMLLSGCAIPSIPPKDDVDDPRLDPIDPVGDDPSVPSDPVGDDPSVPSDPVGDDPSVPSDPVGDDPSVPSDPINEYSRTFYVSSSQGNDLNDGLSTAKPWKTINKLNNEMANFQPGDAVLFKRGDTFNDATLKIATSGNANKPVVFGAYGTGAKPLITSFNKLTNWKNEGAGIYSHSLSVEEFAESDFTRLMVVLNDEVKWMGRWPKLNDSNGGFRTINAVSGSTSFTDNALMNDLNNALSLSSADLIGAEAVSRFNMWVLRRTKITNVENNKIEVKHQGSPINFAVNHGYYLQNHKAFLSEQGEWYYDADNKRLYMYLENAPSNHVIKAATRNNLITINRGDYIVIENLVLEGSNFDNIQGTSTNNNLEIRNLNIDYSAGSGIYLHNANQGLIENNIISNSLGNGLNIRYGSSNCRVLHNELYNSAMIGGVGSSLYAIVTGRGYDHYFQYNKIDGAGAGGMNHGGRGTQVRNNYIKNVGYLLDDIAGIYFWDDHNTPAGRIIDGNIIVNVFSNTNGLTKTIPQTGGIYLDDDGMGAEVTNNIISNAAWVGLIVHKHRDVKVDNNIIIGSSAESQAIIISNPDLRITDMVFTNNVLIQLRNWRWAITTHARNYNSPEYFKLINNNYYLKSNALNEVARTAEGNPMNYTNYGLSGWQSYVKGDANAVTYLINPDNVHLYYNAELQDKTINLQGNYVDVKGKAHSGSLVLKPYTGIVLIKQ
jgi:parallel beta-helix repeat protein